ncbi:hypothetical protein F383_36845 [Gossypium arboreum]|uniref:Uncharacterized protein n=1 Tax=Gossypium arboreum TaxID=29729 RepID=A0A0B0MCV1_GOSAR|nr:hypothetical protein F383_36845 [Gossypium arboreum]
MTKDFDVFSCKTTSRTLASI